MSPKENRVEGAAGAEKFGVLRVSRGKTVILEKNRGFPTQLSVPPLDFGEKWLKGGTLSWYCNDVPFRISSVKLP